MLEVSVGVVEGEGPDAILSSLVGYGIPDRSIDSDRDTLSDGAELTSGSNPCNPDTDGDGLNDGADPNPLVPRTSTDVIADAVRTAATGVEIPESSFDGPNENAQRGRRNALANQLQSAANAIEEGNLEEALSILEHVLDRLDGNPVPPDVMDDGPAKDALREEVERLIALVRDELGHRGSSGRDFQGEGYRFESYASRESRVSSSACAAAPTPGASAPSSGPICP